MTRTRTMAPLLLLALLLPQLPTGATEPAGRGAELSPGARMAAKPREASPAGTESRGGQAVSAAMLRDTIAAFVRGQLDGKIADVQIAILDYPDPVIVPRGRLGLRVEGSVPDDGYGRRSFDVMVAVNGAMVRSIRLLADVTAFADMVVATRVIKPEDMLDPEDVALARVKIAGATPDFFSRLDDVIGKRVVKPLRPNSPILQAAVATPYAIRKGDQVTIEARRGGLVIQVTGVAKGAGQLGQSLVVTNQDSGKTLRAKVVGPGLVRVQF